MDSEMFECDEHDDCTPAAPMTVWDILVALFGLLTGIAQAFEHAFDYMLKASAMANNHGMMQKNFENEARENIERIVAGECDG